MLLSQVIGWFFGEQHEVADPDFDRGDTRGGGGATEFRTGSKGICEILFVVAGTSFTSMSVVFNYTVLLQSEQPVIVTSV